MSKTVTLFRPVGPDELKLIEDSGWEAFPPRLPEQPIFYPVTNEEYAAQIARDWNTKHGSRQGYVTRFDVNADYVSKFDRKIVGGRQHEELWVPAEELEEFNSKIVGLIEVTQKFSASEI
ncbi:ADP-ribosylation/crystallin J1 [Roseibium album]|uniref:ADP-ribosylation/crystallin J1 n=1 Tax=Roseibium album TaxID=311410 RepID=UPI003299F13F